MFANEDKCNYNCTFGKIKLIVSVKMQIKHSQLYPSS